MNNENIARTRIKTVWTAISVMIFTLLFGINSEAHASMKEMIVYNKNMLYINKYNNLVNVKDVINVDYKSFLSAGRNVKIKTMYLIKDLTSKDTFLMPDYSVKLNLKSRVDNRVMISRLANAIKSTETGGVSAYYRKSYSSSACGAYQYMPSTWNNYMGYKNACQAPTWVQDARVLHELEFNYKKYHDWRKVVAAHLMPSRANDMRTWNKKIPGNPTVAQYVNSVLSKANIVVS